MKQLRHLQIALLFSAAIFLGSFLPSVCMATTVQLEWRIISASHKKGSVDPRLKDIYRNLGAVFNYNSYKLIKINRLSMYPNQPISIPFSRNKTCIIKIIRISNNWVHAQIQILKGNQPIFGTNVRLMNGRTLLIGGPSGHGKALIFSLRSFW